uniref:Mitochondrial ribosomal protein S2 n=1 Tax=Ditylenchus dipsaci TaxID=166011 RepID=A0A915D2V0_9BILA
MISSMVRGIIKAHRGSLFLCRPSSNSASADAPTLFPMLPPDIESEQSEISVRIEDMFNARVHYGHKVGTLKNNMKWAIYGERMGVCIFDLDVTQKYLTRALNFLAHSSYHGSMVLFITTNKAQMLPLEKMAMEMNQYCHTKQWRDGTFLNSRTYFGASIRLPDVVVFLTTLTSTLQPHPAIAECAKMAIPTIGIVDTNAEVSYLTYPIPGNDDSLVSFNYYMNMFKSAIEYGQKYQEKQTDAEKKQMCKEKEESKTAKKKVLK